MAACPLRVVYFLSSLRAQTAKTLICTKSVRVGFRRNGFFVDFYFWAAGFFRGFCHRIFSPHFCGKKCPEKSSRKIPGKILQNLYNKNPRHISAEGPFQKVGFPPIPERVTKSVENRTFCALFGTLCGNPPFCAD